MAHTECRKPATPAGDGLSCAVLAERAETSETLASLQLPHGLTPAEKLARERWVTRVAEVHAKEIGPSACRQKAREYSAASLRLRIAATVEREPTSSSLMTLATSFDRRARIFAEATA